MKENGTLHKMKFTDNGFDQNRASYQKIYIKSLTAIHF